MQADSAVLAYRALIGANLRLNNGTEYIRTYPNMAGHPFLETDSMRAGWIAYDGNLYTGVSLNFDIVREEVIATGPSPFRIKLVPEKIDSFAIGNRRFLRVQHGALQKLPARFYEILYGGGVQVLARRFKYSATTPGTDERYHFEMGTEYYLVDKTGVRLIKSKSDLLDAFPAHRERLRRHAQQARLNFRKDKERALVQLAAFYDQIQLQ